MLSPEFITMIIGGAVTIFGAGVGWNKSNGNIEGVRESLTKEIRDVNKDLSEINRQLRRIWDDKDIGTKELAIYKLEQQKTYGEINARLQLHDSNYGEIVRLIKDMQETFKGRFDKLETEIRSKGRDQ